MKIFLEQIVDEVLGVPNNLVEASKDIYDKLTAKVTDFANSPGLRYKPAGLFGNRQTFVIDETYLIGDKRPYRITRVNITIEIKYYPPDIAQDINWEAMGFQYFSELSKDYKKQQLSYPDQTSIVNLIITLKINKYNTWEDIANFMKSRSKKTQLMSSLAHEMKHAYDNHIGRDKGTPVSSQLKYSSVQQVKTFKELSNFNFYIYYTHFIEDLVRPSEFASELVNDGVTKKDFLKALQNSKIYRTLKEIEGISYDKIKADLLNDKEFLENIKQANPGIPKDDNKIVELLLKHNYDSLLQYMKLNYVSMLNVNFLGDFNLLSADNIGQEKADAFADVSKEIDHFGTDYEKFYRYEEKRMKQSANKVLRKLAKLYAYI
jgi:hypothetical protein